MSRALILSVALAVMAPLVLVNAQEDTVWPSDIDPESRSRFPLIERENLDEAGKRRYDGATAPNSKSLAGIYGPGGLRLHGSKPEDIRTNLGPDLYELVILVVARELDQQFEWTLHEPEAVKAGLLPETIDIVRYRKPVEGVSAKEAAIIHMGRQLFREHRLSSENFVAAKAALGKRGMIDAVVHMGRYAGTAILLHTADAQLPPDLPPLLPTP